MPFGAKPAARELHKINYDKTPLIYDIKDLRKLLSRRIVRPPLLFAYPVL